MYAISASRWLEEQEGLPQDRRRKRCVRRCLLSGPLVAMKQIKSFLTPRDYEKLEGGSVVSERDDVKSEGGSSRGRPNRSILAIILTVINIGALILHGILFVHGTSLSETSRSRDVRGCSYFCKKKESNIEQIPLALTLTLHLKHPSSTNLIYPM